MPNDIRVGHLGETLAAAAFIEIGWAPPTKLTQDIGDDFITFARGNSPPDAPEVVWDLGAPVLLQIKASEQRYQQPTAKHRGQKGWWWRDRSGQHFDHWLSFGLPYLLVLVDTSGNLAYWTEICSTDIIETRKGRKIFVPSHQRVDSECLHALNNAAVRRRGIQLEGHLWDSGYQDFPEHVRLRSALTVPRLIAPHPNRAHATINFDQALAATLRFDQTVVGFVCRDGRGPEPESWATHDHWGWRFVSAVRGLLERGDIDGVSSVADSAPHQFARDAARIVLACGLIAQGRYDEALANLEPRAETSPADRGWFLAQKAQTLVELNRPHDAMSAARQALEAIHALDGDLSVSALRGSCAALLFALSASEASDLQFAVTAQDNASSWWRLQSASYALGTDLSERHEAWANDEPRPTASLQVLQELERTAWTAAFGASWSSWRYHTTQSSEVKLISQHSTGEATQALAQLIRVGANDEAERTASRLWSAGDARSLQATVTQLAEAPWMPRQEGATMRVLGFGGDLLPPDVANETAVRIIALLNTEGEVRQLVGSVSSRWPEVCGALARLLPAGTQATHEACARLILDHFADSPVATMSLTRLSRQLEASLLADETKGRLLQVALDGRDEFGFDLLVNLCSGYQPATNTLREFTSAGRADAARALVSSGVHDETAWQVIAEVNRKKVSEMVAAVRSGTTSQSMADSLRELTFAATVTQNEADWEGVFSALESGQLTDRQVAATFWLLALKFDEVPERFQFRSIGLQERQFRTDALSDNPDALYTARLAVRLAAGLVPDDKVVPLLLTTADTCPQYLAGLARVSRDPRVLPTLISALNIGSAQVRAAVARAILELSELWPDQLAEVLPVLRHGTRMSAGCLMAYKVADLVATTAQLDPIAEEWRLVLQHHPSALVRYEQLRASGR